MSVQEKITVELDAMLTLEEAAPWLRLKPRELSAKSRGCKPAIPAFRLNQRVIRFHPRTIIAKLAHDAGVPLAVISASFSLLQETAGKGAS